MEVLKHKLGERVTIPGVGTGTIVARGVVFTDDVVVYPLRDDDGEILYGSSGKEISTGICTGTNRTPFASYSIRLDDTDELVVIRSLEVGREEEL